MHLLGHSLSLPCLCVIFVLWFYIFLCSLSLLSYVLLMFPFPVSGAALSEVSPTSGTVPAGRDNRHGAILTAGLVSWGVMAL